MEWDEHPGLLDFKTTLMLSGYTNTDTMEDTCPSSEIVHIDGVSVSSNSEVHASSGVFRDYLWEEVSHYSHGRWLSHHSFIVGSSPSYWFLHELATSL